ncbi:MAG TPA: PilZ domain-containing protein [Holophagaceae bacterium]|nr:PilZ domain-containing protein [Holophagaceae bacterium]
MSQPELRDSRRVILNGQPQVRFRAAGQIFDRIPLANLSHGGCLAIIPFQEAGALCLDTPVTELVIFHPGMTANPITARVAWTMAHAEGDQVAVGLQFKDMASDTRIALVAVVDSAVLESAKR